MKISSTIRMTSKTYRSFFLSYLFIVAFGAAAVAQPCGGGGFITLHSQADVDNFQANYGPCTVVNAYLDIQGVTDLTPLSGLTHVNNLFISYCPDLASLAGLETLTSVGFVAVNSNDILEDIDPLSNISGHVPGYVVAGYNPSLKNIDGYANITSVGEYVAINGNTALTNLDGLSGITSVTDFFQAFNNPNLTDCCGIHDLLNTPGAIGGSVTINGNQTGCDNVSEINTYCVDDDMDTYRPIDGDCDDDDNTVYPNAPELCDGKDNDCNGQIDEGLSVAYNGNVNLTTQAEVDAWLACFTSINGRLDISGADITDLTPLSGLTHVNHLFISYCPDLASLAGLETLTSVGFVAVNNNDILEDIDPLSNISGHIPGYVVAGYNPSLKNIDGYKNITSVGAYVAINGNTALTNLDGLSGITSVANDFQAFGNPNLTDCCSIHDLINTPGAVGTFIAIFNNQTGCDNVSEINTYCIDADMDAYRPIDGDCDDDDDTVYPNAPEICDGKDNDCNGQTDEGLAVYNGNIMFTTQAQVNAWFDCTTTINGSVMISGYNITDLTPLANIQSITGNLNIQYTGLSSLSGLDNLQSVGGTVTIIFNSSLSSLFGVQNLTAVGGSLMLYYNFQLSDCCDITDLLNIGGVVGSRVIYFNASGCNSQAEIVAQCQIQNLTSNPNSGVNHQDVAISNQTKEIQEAQLFPNPTKDLVNLRLAKGFEQGRLEIFDAQGRSVRQQILSANTLQYQIETATLLSGLYMVKIETDGELAVHRLVVQ